MTHTPVLAVHHKFSLSIGGIVRYRIKVLPSQAHTIDTLQFRIRNSSPVYRNITPGSGPWKISVALIRNPDKKPIVPELVPSIGCAQVCRLDAKVHQDGEEGEYDQGSNEWELEVLSEMVLQPNWVDIKVEVFAVPREGVSSEAIDGGVTSSTNALGGTDMEVEPQVLLPTVVSCVYKDTAAICGPTFPEHVDGQEGDEGLHLVLLTHGIHGTWLDMLHIKEQIDAHNKNNGKTVTFLTDTNHAGTEEGIQMAGQRVALDILEFTGYCDTEEGQKLYRSLSTVARKKTLSKAEPTTAESTKTSSGAVEAVSTTSTTTSTSAPIKNRNASKVVFPRGFSKVSIIGHSLGGLINIYAIGYIEEVTKGAFFNAIRPTHFITMATPLLGIGFEHPWVLGFALSLGCIGQTGKDLALEDRSTKHLKRSASTHSASSGSSTGSSSSTSSKHKKCANKNSTSAAAHVAGSTTDPVSPPECALDHGPEPLLLAMARPGSVSNRVLHQFHDRTSYANIENDMAVRFNTSSMMGIPKFDMDQFFSPEGGATQPRKNFYHSALTSTMALLFPNVPTKAKFLGVEDAKSPIVVVSHVEPEAAVAAIKEYEENVESEAKKSKKEKQKSHSRDSVGSVKSSSSGSSSSSHTKSSSSAQGSLTSGSVIPKSKLDLAQLVAEGYHSEMDWTKIGVFIEYEAHVQIIVRRKWYNLDGWKCVQDLVERFDFK